MGAGINREMVVGERGAEGQNRTVDTGIFSAVLYHLSYLGRQFILKPSSWGLSRRPGLI